MGAVGASPSRAFWPNPRGVFIPGVERCVVKESIQAWLSQELDLMANKGDAFPSSLISKSK